MITVIVLFEHGVCLVNANAKTFGIFLNARAKDGVEFFLSNSTQTGIFVKHRNLFQVVQLREDAHLRKLRYSCDKHELKICSFILQHLIELTQHHTHFLKLLRVVEQSHNGSVVFVEDDNHLFTCLLSCIVDKVAKAVAGSYRQRVASINALVTTNH